MPLKAPDAIEVQVITDFLYTSSAYAGKTDVEKRRLIKAKLDDYNFAINVSEVSKAALKDITGDNDTPKEVQGPAISEGVALVNAHYDGTDKTAIIKQGKPVCIDMTNGYCVTGIDESWGSDEYKVVGIALRDYSTINTIARIPIRLIPPAAVAADEVCIFQTKAKTLPSPTPYPAFIQPPPPPDRRIWPGRILSSPTYISTGTGSSGVSGNAGAEIDVMNIGIARYVPEFTQLVGWKVNSRWYCEYIPPPMIQCLLTEDLILSSAASYAAVSAQVPGSVMAPNEKVKSMGQRPGYKYASGVTVLAALIGTEYVVVKAFQCPVPQ